MKAIQKTSDVLGCVICGREVKSNRRRTKLDIVQNHGTNNNGLTVSERLKQIIEVSVPDESSAWICDICYKELMQLEDYFKLLKQFRAKYIKNQTAVDAEKNDKADLEINLRPKKNNHAKEENRVIKPHTTTLSNSSLTSDEILIKSENSDKVNTEEQNQSNELLQENEVKQDPCEVGEGVELDNNDNMKIESEEDDIEFGLDEMQSEEEISTQEPDKEDTANDLPENVVKNIEDSKSDDRQPKKKHSTHKSTAKKNLFQCNKCGKVVKTSKKLLYHSALHKLFKCHVCNQDFSDALRLKKHIKSDKHQLPTQCCDTEFKNHEELIKHMLNKKQNLTNITNKLKYKCAECSESFRRRDQYREHVINAHFEKYEEMRSVLEYFCSICRKSFVNRPNLLRHLEGHNDDGYHPCDFCGKIYKRKLGLIEHRRNHTGEMPYQCQFCNKRYNAKTSYYAHLRTHKTVRDCLCSICGKGFHSRSSLNRHMDVHSVNKKYDCPVCRKAFKRPDHVKKHLATHTGHKPYLCSECGAAFARSDKLKLHMRKNHSQDGSTLSTSAATTIDKILSKAKVFHEPKPPQSKEDVESLPCLAEKEEVLTPQELPLHSTSIPFINTFNTIPNLIRDHVETLAGHEQNQAFISASEQLGLLANGD